MKKERIVFQPPSVRSRGWLKITAIFRLTFLVRFGDAYFFAFFAIFGTLSA